MFYVARIVGPPVYMWITRTSIDQPVFATMVMLAIVVLGAFSYTQLPVEQMPEIEAPQVFITVGYPGASPEAIESDVIKPIENAVNSVDGVKNVLAIAREGRAFMRIEFHLNVDMPSVTQEIRDKVFQVRAAMPREVSQPVINRATNDSSQQPIASLVVYSTIRSLREVSTLVEQQIVKRLESAYGVGNVTVGGSANRMVQVLLQPERLQNYRLGIDQIIAAIQLANEDLPAGSISRGAKEQLVRVEGKIRNPEGFKWIIVASQNDAPVYLHQVADVVDGEPEKSSISRINGRRAVSLYIFKVQQSNIVEVGKGIEEAVKDLRSGLPQDMRIKTLWSSAKQIEASLARVESTIVEGALLTVTIVFLFLRSWRSTVITGLTLPISVVATFIALHLLGFTLNFLTLMALSLCIGLLIDDAIVVRENIVRHAEMGKSHTEAAREGTREIGLAVTATTFAIIAVFIPVAFMSGAIGRFFYQFGITVAVAVLVSLFVSFTLDPMLSAVWPDPKEGRFRRFPWLGFIMGKLQRAIEHTHIIYGQVLLWILSERCYPLPGACWLIQLFGVERRLQARRMGPSPRVLMLGVAAAACLGAYLILPHVGLEFFPQSDQGMAWLRVNTAVGSSLEYTDAKVRTVEAKLRDIDGVDSVLTVVGTGEGSNYANIMLILTDRREAARPSQQEIEMIVRERVSSIAGIETSMGSSQAFYVSILGPDAGKLAELSQDLIRRFALIPGMTDLKSSDEGENPTIAVRIKNELAGNLGLTTTGIGNVLRPLIAGDQVSTWLGPDGQEYQVIVQLPKNKREIADDLQDLYITSTRVGADGAPVLVPLRQVAQFVETSGAREIRRLNLQRSISISGNAQGRPAGDVGKDAEGMMNEMQLPPGYRFDMGGNQRELNETTHAAYVALLLAVTFIYLVLASQFGSFLQPIAIMASLPLSMIGVLLALLLTKTTLNLFSIIGLVLLMGLVTKNGILLVDFANQGIRAGKSVREAILDAGQIRLRPILMTTMAMIFGMLPMAIGVGSGREMLAPMGRAIIGGLITSTLLTLIVVPVLYTYLHGFGEWVKAGWVKDSHHAAQQKRMVGSGLVRKR